MANLETLIKLTTSRRSKLTTNSTGEEFKFMLAKVVDRCDIFA